MSRGATDLCDWLGAGAPRFIGALIYGVFLECVVGTEITLDVGGLTLDWNKNRRGNDHGMLFQSKDRKRVRSEGIDYEYFAENDEDPGPMEMAFCRPLREVVSRVELLGYSLENIKNAYQACLENWREDRAYLDDSQNGESTLNLTDFEEFYAFATANPLHELDNQFVSSLDQDQVQGRFANEMKKQRIPYYSPHDMQAYSERSYFGALLRFLHPYAVLRLLGENAGNLDAQVIWQYGPLVEAGYASRDEFVPCANRTQTFLIATEGSSDAHILKRAFELLRPEIMDFFRFIDMTESHPFPGTGGLLKFAEGLIKIYVQNQIIFLFDNDAEGCYAYQKLSKQPLSQNMRAMMLPALERFRAFPALGPEGLANADINGRAAAIECYLDLELTGFPPAKVIWTSYKRELNVYHGALEYKESYTKAFFAQTEETVANGSYEVDKLGAVLDAIFAEAALIATYTPLTEEH